jgi:hypothetical protein
MKRIQPHLWIDVGHRELHAIGRTGAENRLCGHENQQMLERKLIYANVSIIFQATQIQTTIRQCRVRHRMVQAQCRIGRKPTALSFEHMQEDSGFSTPVGKDFPDPDLR